MIRICTCGANSGGRSASEKRTMLSSPEGCAVIDEIMRRAESGVDVVF